MSIAFAQFVIDCQDPAALAGFWSGVLGVPVDPGASPYFATVGRAGERPLRPAWMFIKVSEPRIGKNRVHADLVATDWAAEVERVVGLGATRVAEFDEYGTRWVTLTDPGGQRLRHRRRVRAPVRRHRFDATVRTDGTTGRDWTGRVSAGR